MDKKYFSNKTYASYDEYEASEEYKADYQKGFNEGYLLSKHEPGVLNSMLETLNGPAVNSAKIIGMVNGKDQYEREISKDRSTPDWLKSDRLDNLNKPDQLKDKDKDGPDRS